MDGVLIIGEHGDYSGNERTRQMYPRKYFFEQVCGVLATSGRAVPVFNDKHLAYSWTDCVWMYERARELGAPFMAGSSIPVIERIPELEHEAGTHIEEALSLGYFHSYVNGLDSYGFHGLEGLQCMVERRDGGETGIRAVQCLEGDAVWEAATGGAVAPRACGSRRGPHTAAGPWEHGGELRKPGGLPAGVRRRAPRLNADAGQAPEGVWATRPGWAARL